MTEYPNPIHLDLTWKNRIKIRWIGPDQHSPKYGTLMAGMEFEVRADVGRIWIRDGWAEEIKVTAPKASKAKESKVTEE